MHEDTDTAAAAGALRRVIVERLIARARAGLEARHLLPGEWRAVTGTSDMALYVTPEEIDEEILEEL